MSEITHHTNLRNHLHKSRRSFVTQFRNHAPHAWNALCVSLFVAVSRSTRTGPRRRTWSDQTRPEPVVGRWEVWTYVATRVGALLWGVSNFPLSEPHPAGTGGVKAVRAGGAQSTKNCRNRSIGVEKSGISKSRTSTRMQVLNFKITTYSGSVAPVWVVLVR